MANYRKNGALMLKVALLGYGSNMVSMSLNCYKSGAPVKHHTALNHV